MTIDGFQISGSFVSLGLITGMEYGVLAVGLILMYRTSRIINFAQGQIGAFAATFLALMVSRWGVPYWIAFVGAMALGGVTAVGTEAIVVRRLRAAPAVVGVIATLGVALVLEMLASTLDAQIGNTMGYNAAGTNTGFPLPPGMPTFSIGALEVTPAYSMMLIVTPFIIAGLAIFLRWGRTGRAVRASAADPAAAQMAGILPGRMTALAWAIGGALAAYVAILIFPTLGITGAQAFGPGLLLPALAAAVIGRMSNLPAAFAAGVGLGVIQELLEANYSSSNLVELVFFVVILVGLLIQRSQRGRSEEKGSWAAVQSMLALPEPYRRVRSIRSIGKVVFVFGMAVAVVVAIFSTDSTAITLATMAAYVLIGLSVSITTGLGGELSLGQFAIAGTGALGAYVVSQHTSAFLVSLLCGGIVGCLVSLALGLPALRIRGLMTAVTTLGFALAASAWLFSQPWAFGAGVTVPTPSIFGYELSSAKRYYYFCLIMLAAGLWFARNVWRGGIGLRLRAVRDNDDAARAFTVPATLVKLQGFAIAGFVAGIGGGVYAFALSSLSADTFPIDLSINMAAIAVVGGLGVSWGPVLGALFIFALPLFVHLDTAGLAANALGWLVILMYFPGGIAQAIQPIRDRILDALARRKGLDPAQARAGTPGGQLSTAAVPIHRHHERPVLTSQIALEVKGVSKSFGGLRALDNVDLHVTEGETLGLIGPNGAGKTTLFEIISGFTKPDTGTVEFLGANVSKLSPEARGRRGLIRSFQDAALFPTFTVLEAVTLATERALPTKFLPALIGVDRSSTKRAMANEIVGLMGLSQFRDTQIRALSTGTRRITEFACLVALEPTVLLLDEPSSGIAQRETEALARVLARIKNELELTLVIIEHDMPLVMGISDRIVCMAAGEVLTVGPPDLVRADERVIESYLGGDLVAIERSGVALS